MGRAAPSDHDDAPDSDPAMTSREAAKLLGVSITTAQMWMESGMLASWKTPGGHRRTRHSSVMSLLGHQEVVRDEPGAITTTEIVSLADSAYPVIHNESERADFVENTMEDATSETAFHRVTWLANELLDTPIALITFLTSERQIFRSAHGLNITGTPRSWAFCNYTIAQSEVFCVVDATKDARFKNNPLVISAPFARFYAGIRLMYQGMAFGSLCVIDTEPRILRSHERQALEELAALATDILRLQILESKSQRM
ncbi:GAF domain-containing protein [Herbaspirillum sp. alder98]|uniref:GAF domain-containing protein n=1 Tax=Herbaspirillum sp. alder98 TaxID=2913096 RepID=UPI001CD8ECE8|nr:GAF domain-containing protein [Herbaspirillum sp. alder98]MCA1326880.1 excisionase family DNA-binding protein [Herbaspirillum sp. alder98]